ncbi:MAG TPA: hypothetical protein VNX87_09550 [Candidatus Sulfotelmatobacter sp.]|nr:hypothetical protein [Candidatus Sulfotelmatobacter sp.]
MAQVALGGLYLAPAHFVTSLLTSTKLSTKARLRGRKPTNGYAIPQGTKGSKRASGTKLAELPGFGDQATNLIRF